MQPPIVIVGGGPAGMMAGLLFARAGLKTVVLEKHADFLRDFRGDTVHPSTLELFRELGLIDGLLARPHDKVEQLTARMAGHEYAVADFRRLPVKSRFIALMPQWEFLDFVADSARAFPAFALRMNAEAVDLISSGGRVTGVRLANDEAIAARLVIAADGRRSVLRGAARLPLEDLGAPMDVLWFRLSKAETPQNATGGIFSASGMLVTIDRGDYWQCALVIAKGSAELVREQGLTAFRDRIARISPALTVAELVDWEQIKLLSVALDRLTRWHAPGLLAIGDAAHAMSPIGGVGINLAIQDAVATANILAGPMLAGTDPDPLLAKVQARRMLPTRAIQGLQRAVQTRILSPALDAPEAIEAPLALRMLDRFAPLRTLPARLIGLGIRREHIRSPAAGTVRSGRD
ncbi:FAD-dependent oxidoreductase [Sphingomonas gilva]|uniref:FAD-dependent oxidoreductase n=1 Tax=Sphingomonas gilva TaxID=2305907 RepID=A0A396RK14_9SPHN|nr:FAD-dependent oxidoreductase [Sphingomonas gilva]RHW16548.1 FAD-dependent oxidoreductase [Sphingomonas gilva]